MFIFTKVNSISFVKITLTRNCFLPDEMPGIVSIKAVIKLSFLVF